MQLSYVISSLNSARPVALNLGVSTFQPFLTLKRSIIAYKVRKNSPRDVFHHKSIALALIAGSLQASIRLLVLVASKNLFKNNKVRAMG